MKIMKTKKTYEKPSMKEHRLKDRSCLLAASLVDKYGMNANWWFQRRMMTMTRM